MKYANKYAKHGRTIAAVDIGASKISCFIARATDDEPALSGVEVLGFGHCGYTSKPGAPISVEAAQQYLRAAVDSAEHMAGVEIERIFLAAPGRTLRSRRIGVDLEVDGGVVTQDDIIDCLKESQRISSVSGYKTISSTPVGYRLDGERLFDNPVGLSGALLSLEVLSVSVRSSIIENLTTVAERAGLRVEGVLPAPLAAGEACLIEDEKELGVLLIDVGAGSSSYAIYQNGSAIACGGVASGAALITKDIAQIFQTPIEEAERMKILRGASMIGVGDEHRLIDFAQLADGADGTRASRADLCEVIIPRMEEVFELIAREVASEMGEKANLRRVVVTGGGASLLGVADLAEQVLSMKARVGKPNRLLGAPDACGAPGFSVSAGLAMLGALSDKNSKFSLGDINQSAHPLTKGSLLSGVERWFRQNF